MHIFLILKSRWVFGIVGLALFFGQIVLARAEPGDRVSGFFHLYQSNRQQGIPNYITEDFLLQAYGQIQERTVAELELSRLLPALQAVVQGLASGLPTATDPVTLANRDFLAILKTLLAGQANTQEAGENGRANAELAFILAQQGIARSPLWGMEMDYSQFRPRGHYTDSPELIRYFRTVRYASAGLFAVRESRATGISVDLANRLTEQAIVLARLLESDQKLRSHYQELLELLEWRFGPADDLTLPDLLAVLAKKPSVLEARQALQQLARQHGKEPRILSGVVNRRQLEPGVTAAAALTGWRLLPQRYTPESAAFQALVFDQVNGFQGVQQHPFTLAVVQGRPVKGFPSAWELMALLGSREAQARLEQDGDTLYAGYKQARQQAEKELRRAGGAIQLQLELMRSGLVPTKERAQGRRQLNSAWGLWIWLRHGGILYSKQSMTLVDKGLRVESPRPGAWLEPAVTLYTDLEKLVHAHQQHTPHPVWDRFAQLLARVVTVANQAQQTGRLDVDSEAFLNGLDLELLTLTGGPDQPIVVDIHTEANSGMVVENGLDWPLLVRPTLKEYGKAQGALFNPCEFKRALAERLDDQEWAKLKEQVMCRR